MTNSTGAAIPKLVDFGLSKILGPNERATEPFGSMGYCAPEIFKRNPYTSKVDLWSVGCIMYGLINGSLPFDSENEDEAVRMACNQPLKFNDEQRWENIH